jgi:hypothetical protein
MQTILKITDSEEIAANDTSASVDLTGARGYSVIAEVTVTTPAAVEFTAEADDDSLTIEDHGFKTGLKCQVSNDGGALPTGLSGATDYFVIVVDADTIQLASSLVNAQAGTAIELDDDGTGTQTITPTSLAGGSIKLQASIDGTVWVDVPSSSNNVTATANFIWNIDAPYYKYARAAYILTAGQISVTTTALVQG